MDNYGIEPDRELTPEHEKLVSQLTDSQVYEIDMALLSNTNEKWRKVAMVVAEKMLEQSSRVDGIPDIYYPSRVKKLVKENKLEARGNLSHMRFSEVMKNIA